MGALETQSPDWLETNRGVSVDEAARYCGISASYLNKLRVFGGGPVFSKTGRRVSYLKADLDGWRNGRRFVTTSEYQARSAATAPRRTG